MYSEGNAGPTERIKERFHHLRENERREEGDFDYRRYFAER